MAQRKTLSQAQVDLLRWIGDGCPADREVGEFFRISAGALRNRGLITTEGRRASWSASITSAGTEYLAEVDGPNPPVPRQASVSLTQQLVDEVVAAGGSLLVPKRHYWSGKDTVDYAHRARLAQIHGKVPAGKYLRATSASKDELLLELVAEERTGDRPTLVDVPVPARVARLHAVARQFRDDKPRHEISRDQLARAVRIVHAIAIECGRRAKHALGNHLTRDGQRASGAASQDNIAALESDLRASARALALTSASGAHPRGSRSCECGRRGSQ